MSESNKNATALSLSTASSNIRRPRQRMAQNYLLVWVDVSIDQANKDCQNTMAQLKNVVNDVNLCTEPNQCIQILNQVDSERAFVITSGSLGQHLVSEIHDMPQLDAIYILCGNISRHQEWTQRWTKIKGVHTNIQEICHGLQSAVKQCDQDSISVSFLTVNEMASCENLNQLEPTFMYIEMFKEILLDIKYNRKTRRDLAACCREVFSGNPTELQLIDEFQHDYRPQQAIWWYTRECFTHKLLNQALGILDVYIIINMGFFVRDVHQQIQRLYEQQVSSYGGKSFVVYRGQGFMKLDFEKLQKAKGGIMSFNDFLSTSKAKDVCLEFALRASLKPDMVGILFIMSIDPSVKSAPFASVKEESFFKKEDEILFSVHTVFRVSKIKQMDIKNQLYQVELELTSNDDQQLRLVTDRIPEEAGSNTGWTRLGNLLLQIGQFDKAEELYNVLLEHYDEDEKVHYYNHLGCTKGEEGDYEKTIWYYEQGLKIRQKTLPSNHPLLATSYNKIGNVYNNMGEYLKALLFYEKAHEILKKTLSSNHPLLAVSYNNTALIYDKMGKYSKALSYYEQGLEIYQKTFPSNHPSLATSYNNIGRLYDKMKVYSKSLLYYEKALEIWQKTLSSNHPSLATSYNNIGSVYDNMKEYSKALSYYEQGLEIRQKTLPSNHPSLAMSYNNIGTVYTVMGEYSKALSFCGKTLEIWQKALSSNHPLLAESYNNIGFLYNKMGEYSKALLYYEIALEIRQKTLPSNHNDLAISYNNIGRLYDNMEEYSKALLFCGKALEIWQKILPSNHHDLATSYNNIGLVYDNVGEYSKSLLYYEKALEIQQKTLSSNHPSLATSYNNIGSVYDNMEEYSKALSYHEKALEIRQKTLPLNHPDFAQSYNNIGSVYYKMGERSKALSYFERALDIYQRALPPTHPNIRDLKKGIEIVKEEIIKNG
ncbi:unnamed protein product [Adineta steineri]|uniref:NAD(P)(+)--arginine ADP-ribosyltransferase n=1 Tax=Adineta steineri TaxID=433720 RepID=A0A819RGD5_9BILA|nr:unnamed protein product [Adineta steineri]CAF4044008.1 unnamed protein product [Adineta steineri]